MIAGFAFGVLGWATGWQMQATLGAASVVIAFSFLGGLMLYIRDDETSAGGADAAPPRRRPATRPGRSWPRSAPPWPASGWLSTPA